MAEPENPVRDRPERSENLQISESVGGLQLNERFGRHLLLANGGWNEPLDCTPANPLIPTEPCRPSTSIEARILAFRRSPYVCVILEPMLARTSAAMRTCIAVGSIRGG